MTDILTYKVSTVRGEGHTLVSTVVSTLVPTADVINPRRGELSVMTGELSARHVLDTSRERDRTASAVGSRPVGWV
ncbi:MAG: hypothetical protein ACR2LX_09890 [Jatrophihabitans sp.]